MAGKASIPFRAYNSITLDTNKGRDSFQDRTIPSRKFRVQVMTEHYELAWKPVRPVNDNGREKRNRFWTRREEPVPLVRRVKNGFALFSSLSPSFFSLPSNRFNLNISWTDYPMGSPGIEGEGTRGNCNHLPSQEGATKRAWMNPPRDTRVAKSRPR